MINKERIYVRLESNISKKIILHFLLGLKNATIYYVSA